MRFKKLFAGMTAAAMAASMLTAIGASAEEQTWYEFLRGDNSFTATKTIDVTFTLKGLDAKNTGKTYTAFEMYTDKSWGWGNWNSAADGGWGDDVEISGDGTYTVSIDASKAPDGTIPWYDTEGNEVDPGTEGAAMNPASGATVWCVDIADLAADVGANSDGLKERNYKDTYEFMDAKKQLAVDAGVTVSDVQITIDGADTYAIPDENLLFGDIEGKGTFRIELGNVYGASLNEKEKDTANLPASKFSATKLENVAEEPGAEEPDVYNYRVDAVPSTDFTGGVAFLVGDAEQGQNGPWTNMDKLKEVTAITYFVKIDEESVQDPETWIGGGIGTNGEKNGWNQAEFTTDKYVVDADGNNVDEGTYDEYGVNTKFENAKGKLTVQKPDGYVDPVKQATMIKVEDGLYAATLYNADGFFGEDDTYAQAWMSDWSIGTMTLEYIILNPDEENQYIAPRLTVDGTEEAAPVIEYPNKPADDEPLYPEEPETPDEPTTSDEDTTGDENTTDDETTDAETTPQEDDFIPGDVNGDGVVDIKDSVLATGAAKKVKALQDEDYVKRADVYRDGVIDVKDSVMITAAAKKVKTIEVVDKTK